MPDTQTLDDRGTLLAEIAAALGDETTTSRDLFELMKRAQTAAAAASLDAADARAKALNPALPPAEVAAARTQADAALFDAERLANAVESLNERESAVTKQEADAQALAAYESAIAERDRCAARLAAEYPALQKKLVDLFDDLVATNRLVDAANRKRPADFEMIQRAEGKARGFSDCDDLAMGYAAPYNFSMIRVLQTALPDWEQLDGLAWPRGRTVFNVKQSGIQLQRRGLW